MNRLHVFCVIFLVMPAASIGQQVANQNSAVSASGAASEEQYAPQKALQSSISHTGVVKAANSSSKTVETCEEEGAASNKDCKDLLAQQDMAKWARLMYLVTATGAVASVLVAIFAFLTFKQTQRTAVSSEAALKHARESSEKQLRAYVDVFDISAQWLAEPEDLISKIVRVQVQFKNTGHTPAHGVLSWFRFDNMNPAAPAFDLSDPQVLAIGVQGPGAINHLEELKQIDCNTGVVSAWKAGTHSLFAYGKISYTDAFGVARESHFRAVMPPEGVNSDEVIGHDGTKYRNGKFQAYKGGYST